MSSPRRTNRSANFVADLALWASIVLAPVAGGSSGIYVLMILVGLASVAYVASLVAARQAGRALHVHGLTLFLSVLCAYTLLQALPLPPALLGKLSPVAFDTRTFTEAAGGLVPLTYEMSATLREAAKLAVYLMIAIAAYERTRARHGFATVGLPVVAAALAVAGIGLMQRVLGLERVLGFLPTTGKPAEMITTFPNPNHAAGFMTLATLTAIGLALSDRARHRRIGLLVAAAVSGGVAVLTLSRGGLAALIGALLLLLLAVARLRARSGEGGRMFGSPAALLVVLTLPVAAAVYMWTEITNEFAVQKTAPEEGPALIGLKEKLDAVRDSIAMIGDHSWFGVGRGAYESVYPKYKTSTFQLIFTHPENIAAQLLSEWGVIAGVFALVAIASALLLRLLQVRNAAALGALVGVTGVLAHNLIDFSLEIPGVALPAIALFAGAGLGVVRKVRISLARPVVLAAAAIIPVGVASAAVIGAVRAGDLRLDSKQIDQAVRARAENAPAPPIEELEPIGRRHPANPILAAQIAFLAETATPPNMRLATEWANRALYLGPTYGEAHRIAGGILVRAGHQRQGMVQLRTAYKLSQSGGRAQLLREILSYAKSAEDVALTLPRRDAELDVIDEHELARAAHYVSQHGHADWAKALTAHFGAVDEMPVSSLEAVAKTAVAFGRHDLAAQVLERMRKVDPTDTSGALLESRLKLLNGDLESAAKVLVDALPSTRHPAQILRAQIELALRQGRIEVAREAHGRLAAHVVPGDQGMVELAKLEALIEITAGRAPTALRALDDAVQLEPADYGLRLDRAEVLRKLNRLSQAMQDVTFVIERQPNNPRAKQIQGALMVEMADQVGRVPALPSDDPEPATEDE